MVNHLGRQLTLPLILLRDLVLPASDRRCVSAARRHDLRYYRFRTSCGADRCFRWCDLLRTGRDHGMQVLEGIRRNIACIFLSTFPRGEHIRVTP
jgi:hypothetical protein